MKRDIGRLGKYMIDERKANPQDIDAIISYVSKARKEDYMVSSILASTLSLDGETVRDFFHIGVDYGYFLHYSIPVVANKFLFNGIQEMIIGGTLLMITDTGLHVFELIPLPFQHDCMIKLLCDHYCYRLRLLKKIKSHLFIIIYIL